MKRQITFLTLQIILAMTLNAQSIDKANKDSIEMHKHIFRILKSKFDKPIYNYTYESIDNQKEFAKIELSQSEMKSVFDTLETNSIIRIDKTKYGINLNLLAKFPNSFNYNDLWRIGKIKVINNKLYNRLDHKLELYESGSTNFRKIKSKITNGKIIPNNPICVEFQKRMKDTTDLDSLSYGSVEYQISFVSGYKKINMTRLDISKSFKINDDSIKLIDVFDNKVVLEQIDHHTYCANKQLLNTDSIGRKATIKHKLGEFDIEKKTEKESIDYAGENSLTLPKETYLLFKNNPNVTLDEYISNEKSIIKNKNHIRYMVLASPAPINSNFTIYFPIYGFSREFTVKLKDKITPYQLK